MPPGSSRSSSTPSAGRHDASPQPLLIRISVPNRAFPSHRRPGPPSPTAFGARRDPHGLHRFADRARRWNGVPAARPTRAARPAPGRQPTRRRRRATPIAGCACVLAHVLRLPPTRLPISFSRSQSGSMRPQYITANQLKREPPQSPSSWSTCLRPGASPAPEPPAASRRTSRWHRRHR